jgi:anti-sigma-K factor RskA
MKVDQDTLVAYALGMLTAEEAERVEAYLREHPEAAAEVRDYLEGLAAMALTLEPEALPEDAEEALLARIRREAPAQDPPQTAPDTPPTGEEPSVTQLPPRRPRPLWWAGLAAAAALLLAWFGFLQPRVEVWQAERRLEAVCAQPGAVCETLFDDEGRAIGRLAVAPDNRVSVLFDADPPPEQVYQAWEIVDGVPRSIGVWERRLVEVPEPLAEESVFGVTLEPPGGSPQPTSEPIVVVPLST